MSSRFLLSIEIESEQSNCFSINLLVVRNPLYRAAVILLTRANCYATHYQSQNK